MIDIHAESKDPRAARLSNFTNRHFNFAGVVCASLEGILQALKELDQAKQAEICALSGKEAKQAGIERNAWKEQQLLWWNGETYQRASREYLMLITRIYQAAYEQDPSFKQDLLAVGAEDIGHSIGNPDPQDTVLTEVEMIHQLNQLRVRALAERSSSTHAPLTHQPQN